MDNRVRLVIVPIMPQILGAVKDQATGRSANPVGDMMVRLIEPHLQNLMGTFMGGMMPGMAPQVFTSRQASQQVSEAQPQSHTIGGAKPASKNEIEEAFDD